MKTVITISLEEGTSGDRSGTKCFFFFSFCNNGSVFYPRDCSSSPLYGLSELLKTHAMDQLSFLCAYWLITPRCNIAERSRSHFLFWIFFNSIFILWFFFLFIKQLRPLLALVGPLQGLRSIRQGNINNNKGEVVVKADSKWPFYSCSQIIHSVSYISHSCWQTFSLL